MSKTINVQATSMSLQEIVSKNVQIAMVMRGITQQAVADALNISRSTVSQKIHGRIPWSLEDIEKASGLFSMNPEALVAGHGFEPWTSGL